MKPLEKAIACAVRSHAGQRDQSGEPYILHVLSVMFAVRKNGTDETTQVVAALHDTLEDTDLTLDEISSTFGPVVAMSVATLTRRADETYLQYINRIRKDPRARIVKLADLQDNLDPQRHAWAKDDASIATLNRLKQRYEKAIEVLI